MAPRRSTIKTVVFFREGAKPCFSSFRFRAKIRIPLAPYLDGFRRATFLDSLHESPSGLKPSRMTRE